MSGLRGPIWNITEYPDRIEANGSVYLRLYGGGNDLKIEGTYKPSGDTNQPGIQFTRDGQFVDEGILDNGTAMALGLGGGGVTVFHAFTSPKAGRGTYSISYYGLRLNYANGKQPSPLFFLEPGTSKTDPEVVYIKNFKYVRVPKG